MASNTLADEACVDNTLAAVFYAMEQPALVTDTCGRIAVLNDAMIARFESLGVETVSAGSDLVSLFEGNAKNLVRQIKLAASGPRVTFPLRKADLQGRKKLCFSVNPLRDRKTGTLKFLMTVSDRDNVVYKFAKLTQDLEKAHYSKQRLTRKLDNLSEDYKALERFSYSTAHDLKAPLRGISCTLQFLKEDYAELLPAEGIQDLDTALGCAARLDSLVTNLLDLARSGSVALNTQTVKLENIITEISKMFASELTAVDGQINVEGALGEVIADSGLLHLLLQNLIGNAIKYRSPERPPSISVRCIDSHADGTELRVQDNGQGFANEDRHKIFEPFQRLAGTSQIEGSGVGLSICHTVCSRHGWELDCFGQPDRGATFRVSNIVRPDAASKT